MREAQLWVCFFHLGNSYNMNAVKAPTLRLHCAVNHSYSSLSLADYKSHIVRNCRSKSCDLLWHTLSFHYYWSTRQKSIRWTPNPLSREDGRPRQAPVGRARLPPGSTCFLGLYRPRMAPAPHIYFPGSGKRILQHSSAGRLRSFPKQRKRDALCESG